MAQMSMYVFLAKQFPLAGGDIKNVALDAAFLAAQDGRIITMKQLVQALARQMMKQGKIPSVTDFKQFHRADRTTGLKGQRRCRRRQNPSNTGSERPRKPLRPLRRLLRLYRRAVPVLPPCKGQWGTWRGSVRPT